ncbi:MAG TPA: hypothetical protein PKB13_13545 [Clostridia bacterium]|nr:hypothetical protein [Clostridia bacterium]
MSGAFQNAFLSHAALHPLLCPKDAVKFAFQSEFGAEHFVENKQTSLARLEAECAALPMCVSEPLIEPLGARFFRLNLAPALVAGASPCTINEMFVKTANAPKGTEEGYLQKLFKLNALCKAANLPIAGGALEAFLEEYRKNGLGSLHHSEVYREAYRPAYRVLDAKYAPFLEVFFRIDALLKQKERVDVAIDGRCGSGKTTLAGLLNGVYDCNVFHADDFFLQNFQRTKERLAEPGGNVDYERLKAEVTDRLGQSISFRPFDCSVGALGEEKTAPPKRLNIVEGSYSMHPKLEKKYDLAVFLDVEDNEQLGRIGARSGKAALKRFKSMWIPMENRYFEAFHIREHADVVIVTPAADKEGN